jgi:hypothetical protein
VQQRLSREKVHRAFDDLPATAGHDMHVPTEGRDKMLRATITSSFGESEAAEVPGGPRKWSTDHD